MKKQLRHEAKRVLPIKTEQLAQKSNSTIAGLYQETEIEMGEVLIRQKFNLSLYLISRRKK
jgi:hypothetical protein